MNQNYLQLNYLQEIKKKFQKIVNNFKIVNKFKDIVLKMCQVADKKVMIFRKKPQLRLMLKDSLNRIRRNQLSRKN